MLSSPTDLSASPFISFTREAWARLRAATPLTITEAEVEALRGVNERITLQQVEEIYLPLSRLLNLYVAATQTLHAATDTFLGNPAAKVPFVIGVAGSVAVGKSTFSRILKVLLARWPDHPRVDLVTTDGFLLPNRILEERGLMRRKGFPESYDVRRLLDFLIAVKSGQPRVTAPVYSHLKYDIVPGAVQVVDRPDIMILEGLNVLQTSSLHAGKRVSLFVSDFFDFSIYIDAEAAHIEEWYVERFMTLRRTVFTDPASYFHRYASLSDEEAIRTARSIWREINYLNLKDNIEPTRERADLIFRKDSEHLVQNVWLRKL
ncbi:MAG TPA: type I pantothenate kinase [Vicinamibacterales bacterium]|nr:type I pantothenate kinase [Vicinamibacterales bacterium]